MINFLTSERFEHTWHNPFVAPRLALLGVEAVMNMKIAPIPNVVMSIIDKRNSRKVTHHKIPR